MDTYRVVVLEDAAIFGFRPSKLSTIQSINLYYGVVELASCAILSCIPQVNRASSTIYTYIPSKCSILISPNRSLKNASVTLVCSFFEERLPHSPSSASPCFALSMFVDRHGYVVGSVLLIICGNNSPSWQCCLNVTMFHSLKGVGFAGICGDPVACATVSLDAMMHSHWIHG